MKNKIHYLLSYLAIFAILTSCQTSSEFNSSALVKKRTYTKGYHLNLASAKYDKPASARAQAASEMTETVKVAPSEIPVAEVESQAVPRLEGLTASANTSIERPIERSSEVAHTSTSVNAVMAQKGLVTKRDRFSVNSTTAAYHSERNRKTSAAVPMQSASGGFSLLLYVILAILIPPLAVGLLYGISGPFWLSLLLWALFILPGVIYALIKVFQKA